MLIELKDEYREYRYGGTQKNPLVLMSLRYKEQFDKYIINEYRVIYPNSNCELFSKVLMFEYKDKNYDFRIDSIEEKEYGVEVTVYHNNIRYDYLYGFRHTLPINNDKDIFKYINEKVKTAYANFDIKYNNSLNIVGSLIESLNEKKVGE
jgi:hypothetical protein